MCGVSPNFIHSLDAAHMALVVDKWNGDPSEQFMIALLRTHVM